MEIKIVLKFFNQRYVLKADPIIMTFSSARLLERVVCCSCSF